MLSVAAIPRPRSVLRMVESFCEVKRTSAADGYEALLVLYLHIFVSCSLQSTVKC